jgi:hypothetical protein
LYGAARRRLCTTAGALFIKAKEEEIFQRRRRREESMLRSHAARAVAEGKGPGAGAFGDLYPPKDAAQKALYASLVEFCGCNPNQKPVHPFPLSIFPSTYNTGGVHRRQ